MLTAIAVPEVMMRKPVVALLFSDLLHAVATAAVGESGDRGEG